MNMQQWRFFYSVSFGCQCHCKNGDENILTLILSIDINTFYKLKVQLIKNCYMLFNKRKFLLWIKE